MKIAYKCILFPILDKVFTLKCAPEDNLISKPIRNIEHALSAFLFIAFIYGTTSSA